MTRIKLCGLTRTCDIEAANALMPEYIGFVFAKSSRRCVTSESAASLKRMLAPDIKAVGVFVNEPPEVIAELRRRGIIDIAQLHGSESEEYIMRLRSLTDAPIIKAFRIETPCDIADAQACSADYVLLDSGAGTGKVFDWELIRLERPYFLAGGLDADNVSKAVQALSPYAVDVSSGIETDGFKDTQKMKEFIKNVRKDQCYDK